jgi:hypothetical protein
MFLTRGFVFSYEPARDWEAKGSPALAENLRRWRNNDRHRGYLAAALP